MDLDGSTVRINCVLDCVRDLVPRGVRKADVENGSEKYQSAQIGKLRKSKACLLLLAVSATALSMASCTSGFTSPLLPKMRIDAP
jgi:hypothetical protein